MLQNELTRPVRLTATVRVDEDGRWLPTGPGVAGSIDLLNALAIALDFDVECGEANDESREPCQRPITRRRMDWQEDQRLVLDMIAEPRHKIYRRGRRVQ